MNGSHDMRRLRCCRQCFRRRLISLNESDSDKGTRSMLDSRFRNISTSVSCRVQKDGPRHLVKLHIAPI
eukprot:scaffold292422_cov25-Prasinocladus_malaysianus.AAC.1